MSDKATRNRQYRSFNASAPQVEGVGESSPPPAFNPGAVHPSNYGQVPPFVYGSMFNTSPHAASNSSSGKSDHCADGTVTPAAFLANSHISANAYTHMRHGSSPVVVVPPSCTDNQTIIQFPSYFSYKNPSKKDKMCRCISTVLGAIACLSLLHGITADQLATGTLEGRDYDCHVLYVFAPSAESRYAYYSDVCLDADQDFDWDEWDHTDKEDWCSTWQATSFWTTSVALGCLMACIATCWVQICCTMERCCCSVNCPRICFLLALLFCISGNMLWIKKDRLCSDAHRLSLETGQSVLAVWGSCVVVLMAMFFAK